VATRVTPAWLTGYYFAMHRCRRPTWRLVTVVFSLFLCAVGTHAKPNDDLVRGTLLADTDAVCPGASFALGLHLKMKPHWHTYWVNPGESGGPTRIKFTAPAGIEFGAVQWPLPTRMVTEGTVSYGYEDEVLLLIPVTVSKDLSAKTARVDARVKWVSCSGMTCVEGGANLSIELPVRAKPQPANADLFATWKQRLPLGKDQPIPSALGKIEQSLDAAKSPLPELDVRWVAAPRKVDWFPFSTSAVAIDDVSVLHEGRSTKISYKPKIYKADDIPGNVVDGLLVYEDEQGRHGFYAPVRVAIPAAR
jgi:thiol:disulfide interchange protein DsbD